VELGVGLTIPEETLVCALARQSIHPHSRRIAESLAEKNSSALVSDYQEVPGRGIQGRVEGHDIRLGSAAWLMAGNIIIPAEPGLPKGSAVCLAVDGEFRGVYLLPISLRPEINKLIRRLSGKYEIALLSGDNEGERECFSRMFGEKARLHFNQTPLNKLNFILELQTGGKRVMMVGDGLNDAGALKQSDIGIAVVEQAGAFSPASDVILEGSRIGQLAELLEFAQRITRIVRLSFLISAAYNAVGITIAAAGLLSPLVCAILMPLSSASVVFFASGATNWAARRFHLSRTAEPAHLNQALYPTLAPAS